MRRFFPAFLLVCWAPFFDLVHSFTFTLNGQPTQCDPLSISWTGGKTPFRLILVVPGFGNVNMTIPDSNFQENKGSFSVSALPIPKNTQLYFAMSDATGAVSGGTSSLMTVGDSLTGQSCNTTVPANDFFFAADNTLTQCGNFLFNGYQGAIKPLTIFAFIPGGSDSFVLPFSPPNADSFNWKANITAQTQVTFSVIDSQGRNGGTDIPRLVAPSNDKSCLLSTSSSSTSQPSATNTSGPGENQNQRTGGLPTGAIVGIAVAGVVVAVILAALLWWLRRRRSNPTRHERKPIDLAEGFPQGPGLSRPMVGHQYSPVPYQPISMPRGTINPTPSLQSEQQPQQHQPLPLRLHSGYYDEDSSASASSSKLDIRQKKFIVHRDIEEAEAPVELPPSYHDRRAPINGLNEPFHLSHDDKRR